MDITRIAYNREEEVSRDNFGERKMHIKNENKPNGSGILKLEPIHKTSKALPNFIKPESETSSD